MQIIRSTKAVFNLQKFPRQRSEGCHRAPMGAYSRRATSDNHRRTSKRLQKKRAIAALRYCVAFNRAAGWMASALLPAGFVMVAQRR
jgi:hypothetical protein